MCMSPLLHNVDMVWINYPTPALVMIYHHNHYDTNSHYPIHFTVAYYYYKYKLITFIINLTLIIDNILIIDNMNLK